MHLPLVLEVWGLISAHGEKQLWCSNKLSLVSFCRDDTKLVCHPSDWDVNWRPPVQGKSGSPPVQVREPI